MLFDSSARRRDSFIKEWSNLRTRMIAESEFRNGIAHFMMGDIVDKDGPLRYALMPRFTDPTERYKREARKKKKMDPLDGAALSDIEARFTALAIDINDFVRRLEPYIRQLLAPPST